MNTFILELPELKNYYSQAELIKIWEDNQHVPFSDSPKIQNNPNYCVESRIIKIDITKKLNHNIMTKTYHSISLLCDIKIKLTKDQC